MTHRRAILDSIESLDGAELTVHGQAESAGQVYYEIGVRADSPGSVAAKLEAVVEGSEWRVINYADGRGDGMGKPYAYDHESEEEIPSNIRVKKNLYNEHMM